MYYITVCIDFIYGDGGSRTRVQRYCHLGFYEHSWYIVMSPASRPTNRLWSG